MWEVTFKCITRDYHEKYIACFNDDTETSIEIIANNGILVDFDGCYELPQELQELLVHEKIIDAAG